MARIDAEILIRGVRNDQVTNEWLKEKSWLLCQSIGAQHFYAHDGHPMVLAIRRCKPDIPSPSWECLLCVSLRSTYYGPGYTRGDIITICAVCEWIEFNLECEVWYGGDSFGVAMEPFPRARRETFKKLLYSADGRAYFGAYPSMQDDLISAPEPCGMCPGGVYGGVRNGWGKDYASYRCAGCVVKQVTRDSGKTWTKND